VSDRERVLVVGAGIAGLAAARSLTHADFEVELVERDKTWTGEGAGIYLPGNAVRALRTLGLDEEALSPGVVIPRQRFSDQRGRLLFEVDVDEMWTDVGACVALHRALLHAALLEGARDVPIRMGVQVRSTRQLDNRVTVDFDDGATGDYALVVGADGINSSIRRLALDADGAVRRVGQVGWRFVTACPADVVTWSAMLGPRTTFLAVPIGAGRVYCYCDVASAADETDDLVELFADFADPVPDLIASATDVHRGPIEETTVANWSRGRVVLIGDAAHATSPNMAEGAAMALEDAVVLADCLRSVESISSRLAAFEARRHPRTEWVRVQTHRRDRLRYLPPPIRNELLRAFGRRIFRANYRPLLKPAYGST
jgi:2-polyprenyl-6-methoxyphenol hydroxylase-like FAD-dependent oxidoreductase